MPTFVLLHLLERHSDIARQLLLADMEERTPQFDPFADVNVDRIRTAAARARLPSSTAGFHCDHCHFRLPMLIVVALASADVNGTVKL
jgi:hypothetical protein